MSTPKAPPVCLHCGGSGTEQDFDEEERRPPDLSDAEYRRWLLQREYRPRVMDCIDKYLRFGRMARLCESQGSAEVTDDLGVMMMNVEGMIEARKTARKRSDKMALTESIHAQLFVIASDIVWFLASRCYPASHEDVLDVMTDSVWTPDEKPDSDSSPGS